MEGALCARVVAAHDNWAAIAPQSAIRNRLEANSFKNLTGRAVPLYQQKSPTRHLGASSNAPSREERGSLRHGRVAWLTALEPITVAGPRPIHTAFPASPACKLNFECKPHPRECQCGTETCGTENTSEKTACSAVFPVGLALFHQGAQTFLRILKAVELIQENVHRMLEAVAQGQAHAAENGFFRHREHRAGVAVNTANEIVYRFFELGLRDETIHHAEFQSAFGGHGLTGQNKLEGDLGPDEKRKNCGSKRGEDADADFGLREPGFRRGNHEISERGEFRAAADRRSVYHAHDRLAHFQHPRERRVECIQHLKHTL